LFKPNEIDRAQWKKARFTGQGLQSLQESLQEEYHHNRVENGDTHLTAQLGGYDPIRMENRRIDEAAEKKKQLVFCLVGDTSLSRWKHIWLRCQYGAVEHVKHAMLEDTNAGVVSMQLLNAKAPPNDRKYGKWVRWMRIHVGGTIGLWVGTNGTTCVTCVVTYCVVT